MPKYRRSFPDSVQFQYNWRTYQKRVFAEYEEHTEDKKLHVVAPPGSGKTVLGLEVARRINSPTLILAPNLTIRNQWKDRLITDFMKSQTPKWISMDIKKPNFLTISTYQALHAAYRSDKELLVKELKLLDIKTFVVDECHHLQKEWWRSLMYTVKEMTPLIVALTATPPYDVTGTEWQRYQELCGKVDVEINVAELVAAKNLCPHQDYIYFSLPTKEEFKEITTFRNLLNEFFEYLNHNRFFINLIKNHPFLQQPEEHLEVIYENPSYFSALMIFLSSVQVAIPLNALGIIGADLEQLPKMNLKWLELFLNHVIFKDGYFVPHYEDLDFKEIKEELKRIGALERHRVALIAPEKVNKKLRTSTSKLNSIIDIVRLEYKALEENLRMVILTDFIRKEAMPKDKLDVGEINLIGVVPIFELIRRTFPVKIELGILTGSLIIIPKYSEKKFYKIAKQYGVLATDIKKTPLPHDKGYYIITGSKKIENKLVGIMTELFTKGGITVLVGTKSLLGEGWDAPAINALVLATFVGSYVLSNQMRGRAIRTQKKNPTKTANIWHLVCVDNTSENGGSDFTTLVRRFKAFPGISFHEHPQIENGIDRFLLPEFPIDAKLITILNTEMKEHAINRGRLMRDWQRGLEKGGVMREEITVPVAKTNTYKKRKKFLYENVGQEVVQLDKIIAKNWKNGVIIGGSIGLATIGAAATGAITGIGLISLVVLGLTFLLTVPAFKKKVEAWNKIARGSEKPLLLQKEERSIGQIGVTTVLLSLVAGFGITWVGFLLPLFVLAGVVVNNKTVKDKLLIKQWKNYNEHLNITQELKKMGQAVLYALEPLKLFNTPLEELKLVTVEKEKGIAECYLEGGTNYDEQLFMETLQELLSPIENPRYLLKTTYEIEKGKFEVKYFAVPTILGRQKKNAMQFFNLWKKYVNKKSELLFARTPEGRKLLIRARGQSLISGNYPNLERLNAWK